MKYKNRLLTIVPGPPAEVTPTDSVVEDEADENPGHVVERCRRGNSSRTRKDDREVEVFEEVHPEPLVHYPLD
jgi:hypothetical protein